MTDKKSRYHWDEDDIVFVDKPDKAMTAVNNKKEGTAVLLPVPKKIEPRG